MRGRHENGITKATKEKEMLVNKINFAAKTQSIVQSLMVTEISSQKLAMMKAELDAKKTK